MATRAPTVPEEPGYYSEVAVVRDDLVDPFALSIRDEGMGRKKLIWWYIAEVEEGGIKYERMEEDLGKEAMWVSLEGPVVFRFESDRELVQKAYKIYQDSKS